MSAPTATPAPAEETPTYRPSHARDVRRPGFFVKLILMMLINALGLYGIITAFFVDAWLIVGILAIMLVAVNFFYFSSKMIPAKYLVPGMIFLLIYQVFVMGYTGYVSLTNYGQGHNSTKEDAIAAILGQNERRVEGAPNVQTAVVEDGAGLALVVADPTTHELIIGAAGDEPTPIKGTVTAAGITEVEGKTILGFAELVQRQDQLSGLRLQATDDPNDGFYVTTDGTSGYLAKSFFTYDEATDTLTNTETGTTYTDSGKGSFVDAQGSEISPGWRVFVGFENYLNIFSGPDLGGPFLKALLWSFVFSIVSVISTFAFGLFLALVFADTRVKGRRVFQSLLILPYAFPAFLATLVWRGMLNHKFGFINQVFFGGAEIPWLTDGLLAKISILGVNLWLGFPYMFLVALGALQSLPSDVMEAAKMDGAGPLRTVFSVKLPLVLQSTVPLLIASFAFNFNNFALIYMLTGGGPNYPGLSVPLGETDILISMVYKIAFESGTKDYGLASAMSIVIFIVVGVIAWLGFRQTKTLEEL
ncbi:ABC transporter permease subunit [Schaalia canis]|uniref:Maltose/maltodextrin transport system permease protein n=1 Tax=Schaalia canis TaxID=100469 RepID=A0A3P1SJK4_9ACTO|nr:ABC transporter permease subunit [Schaalia canis]RRC96502.1 ABC transporter permease subunit [Schaalia canis]